MKNIVLFALPAAGHLNQITATVVYLISNYENVKVVVYTTKEHRDTIKNEERIEIRLYDKEEDYSVLTKLFENNPNMGEIIPLLCDGHYEFIDRNIIKVVNDLEQDEPDLIIYDSFAIYVNWFLGLYNKRFNERRGSNQTKPFPKVLVYSTSFCAYKGIFPTEEEISNEYGFMFRVKLLVKIIQTDIKFRSLSRKYECPFFSPIRKMINCDPNIPNIIFLMPQFHPLSEQYPKHFHFVGCSINSNTHFSGFMSNSEHKNVLDILSSNSRANPPNSVEEVYSNSSLKLIYVSLGSVLQNRLNFYLLVLKALETFNEEPIEKRRYSYKLDDLCVVMSVGDTCYNEMKSKSIQMPKNVHIAPSVPQIEILKKASVFITHNGMNSTIESIHFGVPMICVPITTDQPRIAKQVVDELQLGVRLNFNILTYVEMRKAIHEVLEEPKYCEQAIKYSKLSNEYNGEVIGSKVIMDYITNPK